MPPAPEPSPAATHDSYAAFRVPAYRAYSIGSFIAVLGRQMLGVAIGYEVFQRTHSSTALGLVGLASAIPVILFALPAGQVADRFQRRNIIIATQLLSLCTSLALAWLAAGNAVAGAQVFEPVARLLDRAAALFGEPQAHFGTEIAVIYLLLLINGTARTFGWAARAPFVANLVPRSVLSNAVTWGSSLFEIGSMAGPALAGFLIAFMGFSFVYLLDAAASIIFIGFLLTVRATQEQLRPSHGGHAVQDLFSGLRFVWNTKAILATVTLDLFAVLLGGATALLPIYADQILHVGPVGLGWLRAAPSIGAFSMAFILAHLPPMKRAGLALLTAVAGFGCAIIVFGISRSFWLSIGALILTGAFDNISVVVRHTLVQLMTPDRMRGRVAAVNNVFIGSSNELGAFESGITAAVFGPVISIVAGGIGTIVVVAAVALKWPEVRQIGSLASVTSPAESDAELEVDAAAHGQSNDPDDDEPGNTQRSDSATLG